MVKLNDIQLLEHALYDIANYLRNIHCFIDNKIDVSSLCINQQHGLNEATLLSHLILSRNLFKFFSNKDSKNDDIFYHNFVEKIELFEDDEWNNLNKAVQNINKLTAHLTKERINLRNGLTE